MKKLKLQLDDLIVESFATAAERDGRGTVQGHYSCNTCEDLDCSVNCTGGTCGPNPTAQVGCVSGSGPVCGPSASDVNMGCSTGEAGCRTLYEWTGCDQSCAFGPC
jgi:hypothetical protein